MLRDYVAAHPPIIIAVICVLGFGHYSEKASKVHGQLAAEAMGHSLEKAAGNIKLFLHGEYAPKL